MLDTEATYTVEDRYEYLYSCGHAGYHRMRSDGEWFCPLCKLPIMTQTLVQKRVYHILGKEVCLEPGRYCLEFACGHILAGQIGSDNAERDLAATVCPTDGKPLLQCIIEDEIIQDMKGD